MADFSKHSRSSEINTFIQSLIASVGKAQDEFFSKSGRYFQGLNLLGDVITDGKADLSAVTAKTPGDFKTTWKEFMPEVIGEDFKAPVNVTIDVYKSPKGHGWTLTAKCTQIEIDVDKFGNIGSTWVCIHSVGNAPNQGPAKDEWFLCPEGGE